MVSCHSRTNISLLTTSTQHQTVTILTTPSPPPPPHFSDHLSVLLLHNTYLVLVLYYTLSLSLSLQNPNLRLSFCFVLVQNADLVMEIRQALNLIDDLISIEFNYGAMA